MDEFVRVAAVRDELQAGWVDAVLTERDIPHLVRSYRDLAFDGVFLRPDTWGHVEAPAVWRDEILTIMHDLDETVPPSPDEDRTEEGDLP